MRSSVILDRPVTDVPGVSTRAASALRGLGVVTVRDLLEHYPYQDKYRDTGALASAGTAKIGEAVTLVGRIRSWSVVRPRARGRMVIAKATLIDDDGTAVEVPFFNQQWRAQRHPEGSRVAVSGMLEHFRSKLQVKNARIVELADDEAPDLEVDRIVSTYPATETFPSSRIAMLVGRVLDELGHLPDHLPDEIRERRHLLDLDTAVRDIHRPPVMGSVKPARDRLVYDELFCLQVGLQQRRERLEQQTAGLVQLPTDGGAAAQFLAALPFPPTGAQERAMSEIGGDLARGKPMHRLLQGDVGSGKTLVAAWTMLVALDAGRQAVLMAPTEVLAEQHFRTFQRLLAPLGVGAPGGPRVELLTGGMAAKRRRGLLAEVAVGDVQLLIGTHALLEEVVQLHDLGVVIVDEQHRFGVEHRTRLRDKRSDGRSPDVLVMTATPIPRSLALTFYGDLDVTVLDELPPGRQEIVTQVIDAYSDRRDRLYEFVRERVMAGERAYVVCPLVTDSDVLDAASAESTYQRLSEEVFPDLSVGLVHGRMPSAEKDTVMEAFRAGDIQILVATTVIEVGVDVPQASIMIVEDADRFGISQLHQLRGRVGRGAARSYCVFFASEPGGNPRLEALAATTDGFRLAEVDLEMRGEGSLFDTRQSGMPDLKLARLLRDHHWVRATRQDARDLVASDPELEGYPLLRDEVERRYAEARLAALETG